MYCILTFGMLTASVSLANLPCSNFEKTEETPTEYVHIVSIDPLFVPAKPKVEIAVTKPLKTAPLPDLKRTAIYDISARTVIMPTGEKLEAHSGLSWRMDNPKYVKVKARGPTPPNHYRLSLREHLFHGIKAIRLNPVDEDRMFGRDGILAHPYMLGSRGDSFGCVSLKDYDRFLRLYLAGQVTDMIVVRDSDEIKQHYAKVVE